MGLSQIQLEAFQEVARTGSFTKAAAALNLTQSALSHRIKNLEEELEAALFVRHGTGARLTELGARLLQYCRLQTQAEEEFLLDLKPGKSRDSALSGTLRIGGVSTLMRSVVIPSLADFLRHHPGVRIEMFSRELNELPRMIASGQVDFLVTCGVIQSPGLIEAILGDEENVLIRSAKHKAPDNVYLDHDPDDQTTFNFFKLNGKKSIELKRSYFDDIYGILDGVAQGFGQAVAPMHLLDGRKDCEVIKGFKSLRLPVRLYQVRQPYYTKLHLAVAKSLSENAPNILSSRP